MTRSGTPGAFLTLAAYPGETVTVDGDGFDMWNWSGVFDLSDQSDVQVSGLRIVNSAARTDRREQRKCAAVCL